MAGWMGRIGFHLEPLADRILHHIRSGERIFADETTLPTLVPGAGKAKIAWLWTYARDDRSFRGTGPPMVAYRFEDSRGGKCPAHHLAGFAGLLQSDGYGAYTRLADAHRAGGPVTLAACWAHLRRYFYELHVAGLSNTATWTVERMAALWRLEEDIRGSKPEIRLSARRATSAAIVAELFERWETELQRIPRKSKLAEAIRCGIRRARRVRTLPSRWSARYRQQYRRAHHPPANHHAQELALRGIGWRWPDMGHPRHAARDRQTQQRRSSRLAQAHPRAHRQRLAQPRTRRPHALELPRSLNGLGWTLTENLTYESVSIPSAM